MNGPQPAVPRHWACVPPEQFLSVKSPISSESQSSTIGNINARGTGISKPRSGRPRKLSARDIRPIVRFLCTNRTTRRYSLTQLKEYFELDVHENTIRKALQEAGYYHRVARRRPYLNKRDRQRRLKYAKEHKDWTVEDWGKVLF